MSHTHANTFIINCKCVSILYIMLPNIYYLEVNNKFVGVYVVVYIKLICL